MTILRERPVTIIGTGRLGQALNNELRSEFSVQILSAQEILAGHIGPLETALGRGGTVFFAQGRSVNVRNFEANYSDILWSRVKPMELVAKSCSRLERAVLVSSTTGTTSGGLYTLPVMQRAYEARFEELFPSITRIILRIGTLIGPGTQLFDGLNILKRTWLLRRLRTMSPTQFPWADISLVQASGRLALWNMESAKWIVANRKGMNLNYLLDAALPGLTIPLPLSLFSTVWQLFGVRSEFLSSHVDDLQCDGWTFVPLGDKHAASSP